MLGHFLDVGAGGEGLFARAGQHRAALAVIGLERGEGGDQFVSAPAVQRVERLRAVERDQRDRAALFDEDAFRKS